MNLNPDYSTTYVEISTDDPAMPVGHGLTFTIGRGNEVVGAAVQAMRPLVIGQHFQDFIHAPGAYWRHLTGDSQLRWLGPEKGIIHLVTAAVVNALWDAWAKLARKPLWQLLADLSPARIVEFVDWRYLTDALTPDDALVWLEKFAPTKSQRLDKLQALGGYPAYTTSAGWLGYNDAKIRRLCREAVADGITQFKIRSVPTSMMPSAAHASYGRKSAWTTIS